METAVAAAPAPGPDAEAVALLELLLAAAESVSLDAAALRGRERVVRLARAITKDHTLTDEEAITVAGGKAKKLASVIS